MEETEGWIPGTETLFEDAGGELWRAAPAAEEIVLERRDLEELTAPGSPTSKSRSARSPSSSSPFQTAW